MGERTVGPMAKRVTSPHPGAAAAGDGEAEDLDRILAGQDRPDDPGRTEHEGHHHGLEGFEDEATRMLRLPGQDRTESDRYGRGERHRGDGRSERRGDSDEGAEHRRLTERGRPPPVTHHLVEGWDGRGARPVAPR